ncbi:hypothetical protein Amet_0933 [Alkaliphilus metalliredigens QYMF]|uniref:Uncharacterized protein n=1 Tax=Alkaliphilus metalliredigens (strain QYMF) TaxID=293826 RepID=A6TLT5_ALKMQ|nr:hypothetical protein Amet_0933 [Alkaliphilus metalliredigens QYMF]
MKEAPLKNRVMSSLIFQHISVVGISTFELQKQFVVAGFHRASPSTSLDKSINRYSI